MRNCLLLVVSLFLLSCQNQTVTEDKGKDTLTALVWNIWHEGHSREYPEVGCEGTIGIIKQSDADVVFIIETYGASAKIADSLGYYHRLLSSNLSVYSRYPIVKTYTFPDRISTFNFGGVEIDMGDKRVRLFDTWLHYLPDERLTPTSESEEAILAWDDAGTRDDEIRAILEVLQPFMVEADRIPIVLAGDFNSHSHLDWTEAAKDMYYHGGAVVNWTVSKEMEKAGFVDTFRKMNPDPVENIGATWIYHVDESDGVVHDRSDRIDYIYSYGAIEPIESESVVALLGETIPFKGKEFLYASDHGLVMTKFRFK